LSPITNVNATTISSDTVIVTWDVPVNSTSSTASSIDSAVIRWSLSGYHNDTTGAYDSVHVVSISKGADTLSGFEALSFVSVNVFGITYANEWTGNIAAARDSATTSAPTVPLFYTGLYTGDGTDHRWLPTGIGVGLANNTGMIILRRVGSTADSTLVKFGSMGGDTAYVMGTLTSYKGGLIYQLTADSVEISADTTVNGDGIVYQMAVFQNLAGYAKSGVFTGTGANQDITGLGFQPDVVFAKSNEPSVSGAFKTKEFHADSSVAMNDCVGTATRIKALGVDGFSLGNSYTINESGDRGWYFAFKLIEGFSWSDKYLGTGATTTPQEVSGVTGESPDFIIAATSNGGVSLMFRSSALGEGVPSSTFTYSFGGGAANYGIQTLSSTGFTARTSLSPNNVFVRWVAIKNNTP
jgi:hypothetical protein